MSEDQMMDVKGSSSWQLPAIVVLGLIALGGLAFGWNASSKLDSTQQAVASQLKTTQQSIQQDMTSLKDRLAQDEKANTDLQGDLKVVNEKHNQFNVAMTVEDKRFLKKNRALNEPIFFYLSGTHIPEEIVINKVTKDSISGYVSIPKANSQVASAA